MNSVAICAGKGKISQTKQDREKKAEKEARERVEHTEQEFRREQLQIEALNWEWEQLSLYLVLTSSLNFMNLLSFYFLLLQRNGLSYLDSMINVVLKVNESMSP